MERHHHLQGVAPGGVAPWVAPGFVYFAEILGRDVVKIGFTRNLKRRLVSLRHWASLYCRGPWPDITLLATFRGNMRMERRLHAHFSEHLRWGNEGFCAGPVKQVLPGLNLKHLPPVPRACGA